MAGEGAYDFPQVVQKLANKSEGRKTDHSILQIMDMRVDRVVVDMGLDFCAPKVEMNRVDWPLDIGSTVTNVCDNEPPFRTSRRQIVKL
jgi:hypothetical protein